MKLRSYFLLIGASILCTMNSVNAMEPSALFREVVEELGPWEAIKMYLEVTKKQDDNGNVVYKRYHYWPDTGSPSAKTWRMVAFKHNKGDTPKYKAWNGAKSSEKERVLSFSHRKDVLSNAEKVWHALHDAYEKQESNKSAIKIE